MKRHLEDEYGLETLTPTYGTDVNEICAFLDGLDRATACAKPAPIHDDDCLDSVCDSSCSALTRLGAAERPQTDADNTFVTLSATDKARSCGSCGITCRSLDKLSRHQDGWCRGCPLEIAVAQPRVSILDSCIGNQKNMQESVEECQNGNDISDHI